MCETTLRRRPLTPTSGALSQTRVLAGLIALLAASVACGGSTRDDEPHSSTGDTTANVDDARDDETGVADEGGSDGEVSAPGDVEALDAEQGTDARDAVGLEADDTADGDPEAACPGTVTDGMCHGTVDPTSLGDGIAPVRVGIVAGDFGHHWYCAPVDRSADDRLLVYLVGTFGDPAAQHAPAARACALGMRVIAPMYENRVLVRTVCDEGSCFERFRTAIIEGGSDPVVVAPESSIRNRIATLLGHLADVYPQAFAEEHEAFMGGDFRRIVLAGHSQGAGHALYMARDTAAERVVMLAGPGDRLGERGAGDAPVPWIAALAATPPLTALRLAYIHDDDSFQGVAQVVENWDLAGVEPTRCELSGVDPYDPACRRIHAPSDGCDGLAAHMVPILTAWGSACQAGGSIRWNHATWDHLMTAGR